MKTAVNLFAATKIKEGSIERLLQYENPDMIFELINPIVSLKK